MKALSLWQPFASLIANGSKTIETRKWPTHYRGPLLICSTKQAPGRRSIELPPWVSLPAETPFGSMLAVVDVVGCREMEPPRPYPDGGGEIVASPDELKACCYWYSGAYAWLLSNIRRVRPYPVRGSQGFFEVDDALIIYETEGKPNIRELAKGIRG